MFNHFLNLAYGVVYTDQIIGYTSNGQKSIPKDELETIQRNFIRLTFQLMGHENEDMLTSFYGGRDVIIQNMIVFIRAQIGSDSIAELIRNQEIGGNII
jgi:hypothetical protein